MKKRFPRQRTSPVKIGSCRLFPVLSLIEVGAAHEVVAARAAELAFLIVQLVAATWTPTPMFAFGSAVEMDLAFGGVNRLVVGGGVH
jgi:hypothetical protein